LAHAKPLRFLLFALLSLVFVSEAAAQARAESSPIRFSVAAGFNMSRLNLALPFDPDLLAEAGGSFDEGSRFGLVVGGLVDFRSPPASA
jgi:hypothetical protein